MTQTPPKIRSKTAGRISARFAREYMVIELESGHLSEIRKIGRPKKKA